MRQRLLLAGGVALLALLVLGTVRLLPGDDRPVTLPPPEPVFTLPPAPSGPQAPISLIPSPPTTTTTTSRAARSTEAATTTAARGATKPPVTGRYRVLDSYGDSFIGEVAVTNDAGDARDWTVTLTFPDSVTGLRTSWLESLPQPTLTRDGRTFRWRSSVPLSAGATGLLRFHLERSGRGERPSACTVNGARCVIP